MKLEYHNLAYKYTTIFFLNQTFESKRHVVINKIIIHQNKKKYHTLIFHEDLPLNFLSNDQI